MAATMGTETTAAGMPRIMNIDGVRTRVIDEGEGIPVVLLHGGYPGDPVEVQSSAVWDPVIRHLAGELNIIAIDRLGQGFTDNPASADDYSVDAIADHVVAVLRHLDKGPYHLVGHDEGAFIATQIAVAHPELVCSMTLVSANVLTPGADRRCIIHSSPPLPLLSRHSLRWVYEASSFSHLAVTEDWLDEPVAIAATQGHRAAVEAMQENDRYLKTYVKSWTARRSHIHRVMDADGLPCPTLVVWGLNDPVAPVANAEYLMELLTPKQRDTELRIFNSAGYYPFREHPAAFSRTVLSFVRDNNRG